MYAIVDIETNGGSFRKAKITEIAIFLYDGYKIVDSFVSLVNPETTIPPFITKLTEYRKRWLPMRQNSSRLLKKWLK